MPLAFAQSLAPVKRPAQRPLRLHLLALELELEPQLGLGLGLATEIVTGLVVIDLVGPALAGFDLVGSGPVEIVLVGLGLERFDPCLGLALD